MWHSRPPRDPPPPFMANAILNFHFDYLTPSLNLFRQTYRTQVCTWNDLYLHENVKVFTIADHHCLLISCRWPMSAEICSILLSYISLLSWYGNLCNQYRDSINNDKDCRIGQCAMCRDLLLLLLLVSNWLRLRAFLEVDICSSQHYYTTTMISITGTLQQHEYKHKYRVVFLLVRPKND